MGWPERLAFLAGAAYQATRKDQADAPLLPRRPNALRVKNVFDKPVLVDVEMRDGRAYVFSATTGKRVLDASPDLETLYVHGFKFSPEVIEALKERGLLEAPVLVKPKPSKDSANAQAFMHGLGDVYRQEPEPQTESSKTPVGAAGREPGTMSPLDTRLK
jgi:hypothetical protein